MSDTTKNSGSSITKFTILKVEKSDMEDKPVCRYCHSNATTDLIRPCKCTGTIAFVHRTCLESWLKIKELKTCELCSFEYVRVRELKPCSLLNFWKWLCQKETKLNICVGVAHFHYSTTCIPMLLYSSVLSVGNTFSEMMASAHWYVVLSFFTSCVFVGFCLCLCLIEFKNLRYFLDICISYRDQNYDDRILDIHRNRSETVYVNMEPKRIGRQRATYLNQGYTL